MTEAFFALSFYAEVKEKGVLMGKPLSEASAIAGAVFCARAHHAKRISLKNAPLRLFEGMKFNDKRGKLSPEFSSKMH